MGSNASTSSITNGTMPSSSLMSSSAGLLGIKLNCFGIISRFYDVSALMSPSLVIEKRNQMHSRFVILN
jgi:hypothetical protein